MQSSPITTILSLATAFFLISAAAVSAASLQLLSYVLVYPFSHILHRRIVLRFSYAFFLFSTFLLEIWSSVTIKNYGDRLPPSKSCLIILNHSSSVDWILGLAHLAKMQYPSPGNAKSIVKASLANVPLFGHVLRFSEFLFISRSWNADRDPFLNALRSLQSYTNTVSPMWLVLFPEGTRLTPEKLQHSCEYAAKLDKPALTHVLYPRFKAFTSVVHTMRDHFDYVVDATYIFDPSAPSLPDVVAGKASTVVHAHVTCYPMQSLPRDDQELENWLVDRWYEKDARIAHFRANPASLGTYDENFFPVDKPSVVPFYLLVLCFSIAASLVVYRISRIPNGLYILSAVVVALITLMAISVVGNSRPSRKGTSR